MQVQRVRSFISDWEGPFGKNDYAMEISDHFLPNGALIFTLLSKYDDILADVLKRNNYGAGDTLKLILPFLRAYGATNDKIEKFAAKRTRLLSCSLDTLQFVKSIMPSYIISASYDICFSHIWKILEIPRENFYCTKLNIDDYELNNNEKERLNKITAELINIANQLANRKDRAELINIPKNARHLGDFSKDDREIIEKLDSYFWEEIYSMDAGRMLKEVEVVDSSGKAEVIKIIRKKLGVDLRNCMYIGDSITDTLALRYLRENNGLAISFNGNEYAIKEAEIAVISDNTVITSLLANIFNKYGKKLLIELIKNWSLKNIEKYSYPRKLQKSINQIFKKKMPRVEIISKNNIGELIEESTNFRKRIRGEIIGVLG
ncbi:hypothetical protein AC481_07110 [miscellaneous Crenarchaeota group archaeon SMTZ-80]|nr:MAG: hypothetical protein AC481_07110 [miscellaneous Crenarchaeota group archaeon SMTZ-80]